VLHERIQKPLFSQGGFTLIELLIVIAIIAVLSALLFPAVGRIQEKARLSQLISNLRTASAGLHGFAADHDGRFPYTDEGGNMWSKLCAPYVGETVDANWNYAQSANRSVFRDPLDETFLTSGDRDPRKVRNIALNGVISQLNPDGSWKAPMGVAGRRIATIARPASLLMATTGSPASAGTEYAGAAMRVRHTNFTGANADTLTRVPGLHYGIFVDGHVRAIPFAEMKEEAQKAASGMSILFDDRANNPTDTP